MKPKFHLASIFTTLFVASSAAVHADTEWIGSPGGNLFNPSNWSGNAPVEGVAFDENILMVDGSASGGTLVLSSGRTLTLKDFTLTTSSFQGVLLDSDADSVLNAIDSIINCNNVALDAVVNLTGTSEMHIFAPPPPGTSRNTINGAGTATNGTKVTLSDGCKVVHENGNDSGNAGAKSVGQRIIRAVSGTSFATDLATPPLTEFSYSGPADPFAVATTSPFTITALDPNPPPPAGNVADILVGYQLVPPQTTEVVWLPTVRTATDWQVDLDFGQISNFGYSGTTDVYLADLNGDGMSDKVWRQTINGGANPSQIVVTYTTGAADGFKTSTSFFAPDGDNEIPFSSISAADTKLIFGDIDGDQIDDAGVTVDGGASGIGGTSGALTWGIYKSAGVVGISSDQGGNINFIGWNVFGDLGLGDVGYLGDFNGDGIADRMIRRTSSNQIFIDLSTAGGFGDGAPDYAAINLGIAGDTLSVSDINGDGKDDLVLARNTNEPPETPENDLQTLYGFYNDGNGFSTLNATSPDITDIWGFGPGTGFLFGNITPVPSSGDSFKITQITSAGPDVAFSGTFRAVRPGNYQIEASLNLQAPWEIMEIKEVTTAVLTNFSISDTQLDTAFGPGARPKVFVRVVLLPQ